MNQVEVDPLALDGEVDRLIAGAAPELTADPNAAAAPGTDVGILGGPGPGSWIEVTPGLVAAADIVLLPAWQLRVEEKEQLSRALGDVLDQIFPGGLSDPRWAPYVRLIAIGSAIAFSRMDPKTGKLPAFGPLKRAEQTDDAAAATSSAGDRRAA